MVSRDEFLSGCLEGWADAAKEDPGWIDLTKSEKKAKAKEALEWFDKMYFSLSMIEKIAKERLAMLDDKPEPKLTDADKADLQRLEGIKENNLK